VSRIRTHPGEVLREEFMGPMDLSANRLAIELSVPATRIGDIIRNENPRAVTADTALRLARYFGTTAAFWMNLQAAHDLSKAELNKGREIAQRVRPRVQN
jgi:addiction module HigA family antidote